MKNAFLVIGGWEGHAPEQSADVFAPLLEKAGFEVRRENTLDACLDKTLLESQDLTVPIWTRGEITTKQLENLQRAVHSGIGMAGWHGCMAD